MWERTTEFGAVRFTVDLELLAPLLGATYIMIQHSGSTGPQCQLMPSTVLDQESERLQGTGLVDW